LFKSAENPSKLFLIAFFVYQCHQQHEYQF
jgi:hypothetical protein